MNPKNAPYFGPKNSDPIITGICMVVARINGRGINPSGVKASRMIMAENMPAIAIYLTLVVLDIDFHLSIYDIGVI